MNDLAVQTKVDRKYYVATRVPEITRDLNREC